MRETTERDDPGDAGVRGRSAGWRITCTLLRWDGAKEHVNSIATELTCFD